MKTTLARKLLVLSFSIASTFVIGQSGMSIRADFNEANRSLPLSNLRNDLGLGQKGSTTGLSLEAEKEIGDNLLGIDFEAWATSVHYARWIRDELFLGGEIGFLPSKFDRVVLAGKNFTERNTIWSGDRSEVDMHNLYQLLFFHFFVRWKPELKWIEIDGGLRLGSYVRSVPHEDSIGAPTFFGLYIKPAIGFKKFKIGMRLDFGGMSEKQSRSHEFVIISSPFIRFNFK